MKIRKGMTLIEIVISIFILSMLSILYMQNITKQYALMQDAKITTKNAFSSAKNAEQDIQYIKDVLGGLPSPTPLPASAECVMFSDMAYVLTGDTRKVEYYPVMKNILDRDGNPGRKKIYCVVADLPPEEVIMPVIQDAYSIITVNGAEVEGVYATTPNAWVEAVIDDVSHPEMLGFVPYTYEWYISEPNWLMRWNNVEPYLAEIYVPMFPQNFSIIPDEFTDKLKVEEEMAGRHVICVITPYGAAGKKARPFICPAKYIYGLPVLGPLAHYDTSMIDGPLNGLYDSPIPGSNRCRELPGTTFATKLMDISGNGYHGIFYNDYPEFEYYEFPNPNAEERPIKAQVVYFFGIGNHWAEPTGLPLNADSDFTMFAVVRPLLTGSSMIISNGAAWEFYVQTFTPQAKSVTFYPSKDPGNWWYVLGLNAEGMRSFGRSGDIYAGDPVGDRTSAGTIRIGFARTHTSSLLLAELIIYDRLLSESEWHEVTEYLGDKYNIA